MMLVGMLDVKSGFARKAEEDKKKKSSEGGEMGKESQGASLLLRDVGQCPPFSSSCVTPA